MILSNEQRHSALWRELMHAWRERIDNLRAQMEGDIPESQTAKLRGRIQEIRSLMALDKEPRTE